MKRGVLEKDVLVNSPKVLPVIEILTSRYGHPRNATKTYDISSKLRQMIEAQVRTANRAIYKGPRSGIGPHLR